jgi:hypothetical protein
MAAYSFQKRFIPHILAGLESGPWLPGMKRHTLRRPRVGRQGHARPEQPVHLFTGMRTKACRKLGLAVASVQIPVTLATAWHGHPLVLMRRDGAVTLGRTGHLAPVVQLLLFTAPGFVLCGEAMEEFARADGFADLTDMLRFFDAPAGQPATLDMVLIGWRPRSGEGGHADE